ncbi:hypothetical protein R3W88_019639 [Solanum pinnatisectum]|uniref:Uncharacterized protein n=1 Tax=Solanum pinnatisectum TaxID=50273 RepID=A0AAV9KKV8_9SOLN|nr:hypothetical protein R3W88_019639 [Solanum pinnatisectum]
MINYVSVSLTIYADEAQASGVADIDLTAEEIWPNITQGRKSFRPKGKHSIEINKEPIDEDCVMNDVGKGGDHNNRWMEENHTLYLDFNSQNEFMSETAKQPSNLIIPLLRYQKEWLAWALKQEESTARGGILADDMRMGKIVQAMALVLAKSEIGQANSNSSLLSHALYVLPAVKGTLVICPVVALIQWVNEINRFTTIGSNKVLVYHGANREKDIDRFAEYDFVITTNSTIETEYMILHSMKWNRIILDESHCVKDIRSNNTRAILALESYFKWALSGTPLQNHVGELYSLVRFLQMNPYSYYFCKDCDCRALDNSLFMCPHCHHKSTRNHGIGKDAMVLLKHKILKMIMLRCTKKGRVVTLRKDSLVANEEDYYTSLREESRAKFNVYIQDGTLMNNYADIFDLLTHMRQVWRSCFQSEFFLIITVGDRSGSTNNVGYVEQSCGLCHDLVEDPVSCLISFSVCMGQISCPSCPKSFTVDFTANDQKKANIKGFRSSSVMNKIRLDNFQKSTKIEALRKEIRCMIERDGSTKAIVFSQFTSFLDLIHYSLQKSGISCVQLDGSMNIIARDSAITKLTNNPDCIIFIMSLKAGGLALNPTVASLVFLMDPWWNAAVERQALGKLTEADLKFLFAT